MDVHTLRSGEYFHSRRVVYNKVIREDISANMGALEQLHADYNTDLLLVESGGDNLAANYSRELADYIIYVVSRMKDK